MAANEIETTVSHNISIENRHKMGLSGVLDVTGFDDNTVILKTSMGSLTVCGEKLHIGRIDLDVGVLELDGKIVELCYADSASGHSFWQKLFG